MYDLPMDLGWLLFSFDFANDPLNRFGGLKMTTSPSALEADRLLIDLKKIHRNV